MTRAYKRDDFDYTTEDAKARFDLQDTHSWMPAPPHARWNWWAFFAIGLVLGCLLIAIGYLGGMSHG